MQKDIKYETPEAREHIQHLAQQLGEESKAETIKVARKELREIAKLSPDKQERKLEGYLQKNQSKYIEVPRDQMVYVLEHLKSERGHVMSPLEKMAYRSTAVILLGVAVGLMSFGSFTGFAVSSGVDATVYKLPVIVVLLGSSAIFFLVSLSRIIRS